MQEKALSPVSLIVFIVIFNLTIISGQELTCVYSKQTDARFVTPIPKQPPSCHDSWLGRDKILHFTFSMFLYTGSYAVQKDAMGVKKPAVYSAGFTFSIGLGKEIFDRSRPPNFFSWKDVLWNCAGIGTGFVLTNIFYK